MNKKKKDSKYKIVVLQRGWVVVGKFLKEKEYGILENAAVIRRWGTTKGLPELVNGPLPETILDKSQTPIRFHELTSIMILDCGDKWSSVL